MKCANANHVLQKCIGTMRPMDSQFIIDELVHAGPGAVAKAARHRYGCRVLQRLYEHCAPDQMRLISEDLVKDALPLCRHIFAKYVMQHLIEHGSDEHVAALTQMLALHAPALGADGSACAVIGKALEHSGSMAQVNLVQSLLQQPALLTEMSCSRHGHLAAKLALELSDGFRKRVALTELADKHYEKLKASRYGRVLIAYVRKCMVEER